MKKLFGVSTFILLSAASIQTAYASKIYTCVINGEVTYTSRPSGNCNRADLPAIGRYSNSRYNEPQPARVERESPQESRKAYVKSKLTKPSQQATAPTQPAPTYAPKLSANNSRRSILEQELNNERKALSDAQQSLADARAAQNGTINQQLISQLQGNVLDRQQNIQALQRELGRM
ncbi:hypothetical protein [Neisseria animaloris]|uniref:hypothetical protein n=1 Tax=Neisseria animaloris TaxID=326522 RepID=UPI000D3BD6F0|nr:hypothetical protein [Neisseria animaloris]